MAESRADIEPVSIPTELRGVLGRPDPGTRCWRWFGTEQEMRGWFDAVMATCAPDGAVSPGGVAMYARVSRAGVHKRMTQGRITAFMFHQVDGVTRWTKREKLALGGRATQCYMPVSECRSWAALLENMTADEVRPQALGNLDHHGSVMAAKCNDLSAQQASDRTGGTSRQPEA